MKILTYNSLLESNLSYSHTMRQLIGETQNIEGEKVDWLYGAYEQSFPFVVPRGNYNYIPCAVENGVVRSFQQNIDMFKPDVLFMHDDPQRCMWLEQVRNVPTFYWLPWDNEDPRSKINMPLAGKVDRCVMVAKFAQEFAKGMGYDCGQIYNPINTDVYHPDRKAGLDLRAKFGIPEDDKILLWVGRPGWRKRLTHIIAAAAAVIKKNPKVHLLLHMDKNDPGMGFNVEELIYAFGLDKGKKVLLPGDLNFLQGYPPEVMNAIYNAADVYIAPHGGEGMGLPIVEAMSCGKPFVATDYSTTQEFAGYVERGKEMIGSRGIGAKIGYIFEDKGILRPYVDLEDFTKKIEMLLADESLRTAMGKAGRLFVQKEVDYRVVGQKWTQEFRKAKINEVRIK